MIHLCDDRRCAEASSIVMDAMKNTQEIMHKAYSATMVIECAKTIAMLANSIETLEIYALKEREAVEE